MVAIQQGPSQKAGAQKQESASFFCVIANQGHCTRNQSQQGGTGLKQGVQFGGALPGGAVGGEAAEKQNQGEKDVGEGTSPGSFWRQNFHLSVLSAKGRFCVGADGFLGRSCNSTGRATWIRRLQSRTCVGRRRRSRRPLLRTHYYAPIITHPWSALREILRGR